MPCVHQDSLAAHAVHGEGAHSSKLCDAPSHRQRQLALLMSNNQLHTGRLENRYRPWQQPRDDDASTNVLTVATPASEMNRTIDIDVHDRLMLCFARRSLSLADRWMTGVGLSYLTAVMRFDRSRQCQCYF